MRVAIPVYVNASVDAAVGNPLVMGNAADPLALVVAEVVVAVAGESVATSVCRNTAGSYLPACSCRGSKITRRLLGVVQLQPPPRFRGD